MSYLERFKRQSQLVDVEAELSGLLQSWSQGFDSAARAEIKSLLADLLLVWERALRKSQPAARPAQRQRQRAALEELHKKEHADRLDVLRHAVLGWRLDWIDERALSLGRRIVDGELAPAAAVIEGQSLLNDLSRLTTDLAQLHPEVQKQLAARLVDPVLEARFARYGEDKSLRLQRYLSEKRPHTP